jgi:hypothetical protein
VALGFEGGFESPEEIVECPSKFAELVVGAVNS